MAFENQPTLPPEGAYTDIELFIIAESPPWLWPENQNSNFGTLRHVVSLPKQDAVDTLTVMWSEMFLNSAVDFLSRWEKQLGLPPAPEGWSVSKRRWVAKARAQRTPFTIQRRVDTVWYFIAETLGSPIELRDNGVPLTNDGLELRNEMALDPFGFDVGVALSNLGVPTTDWTNGIPLSGQSIFTIIEDVSNYSYQVRILDTYALDPALERELQWMTPAGITGDVVYVPVL
jgi:hypothetical protein